MDLIKLATATIITLSMTLTPSMVLSQEQEQTVDQNLNQAEQNIDNAGENLKDAGKSLGNSIENTGEAAGQGLENTGDAIERNYNQAEEEVAETAAAIEEKANWGWLGLLGLLGLFGLAGKNKKEVVVERRELDPLTKPY